LRAGKSVHGPSFGNTALVSYSAQSGSRHWRIVFGRENAKMHMSGESLLVVIMVGVVAGWLAGQITQGAGFGILGDLIVGIAGAFVGSWLLPQLHIHFGQGIVSAIVNAMIGAVLLLFVIGLVRGGSRWRRT
jgi:uncharacterized membrane protein YeaQ/YmgE (transglycosylase-associated protein family)